MGLGYSEPHCPTNRLQCCGSVKKKAKLNTHQLWVFFPRKHILLSKCWHSTSWKIFIRYNNQHCINLVLVFCHPVSLSSPSLLPSLMASSPPEGIQVTCEIQHYWFKCILLVFPNTVDNCVLLASSPHLLCLLSAEQQLFRLANEKSLCSRIRLINGRSECLLPFNDFLCNFWLSAEESVANYFTLNTNSGF